MKETWLHELGENAHEVKNKIDETHDRAKRIGQYPDDVEKLYDLVAHERPQAVQWAQKILQQMIADGHHVDWAGQALAFLKDSVPEKYLMSEDPRQEE